MKRKKTTRRKPKVFCLEGIHGVGKTTIFNGLKRKINNSKIIAKFYSERIANKPLFPFGSKDKQIAFRSEIHFIQQMIERNKMIEEDIKKRRTDVFLLDRSSVCVPVYSKALNLDSKDFKVIEDLFLSVNWAENIIIFMEASPETLLSRINKRGSLDLERLKWNEDDIAYINRLKYYYNDYLKKYEKKKRIIRINTDNLNIEQVLDLILQQLGEILPRPAPIPGQELLDSWIS